MNLKDLEEEMRSYESYSETKIPQGFYRIVRLDGRSFHKVLDGYKKPFDMSFSTSIEKTITNLMRDSGFRISYAYTQSDEISFLLSKKDISFENRLEKILSVLSGLTSSYLAMELKKPLAFDARMIVLPDQEKLLYYFIWRYSDSLRNALTSVTYWTLRKEGDSEREAMRKMYQKGTSELNELLRSLNGNITDYDPRFRYGIGFYWDTIVKDGYNPKKDEKVKCERRVVKVETELPKNYPRYLLWLKNILKKENEDIFYIPSFPYEAALRGIIFR